MILRNRGGRIYRTRALWPGEEIHEGRRKAGSCTAIVIVGAITVIAGILFWQVGIAAHAETIVGSEMTDQDRKHICGLDSVVCEGELTTAQERWIDALEQCESSGNPKAVNPKDTDGTPSYGAFQFKPSTFEMYSKRYGFEGELMDREAQKRIVIRMMDDVKVKWQNEFPACVRKLGKPTK